MREKTSAKKFVQDFYEIQRKQWQKSLFLFLVLFIFYFILVGFVSLVFLLSLGLFLPQQSFFSESSIKTALIINFILSAGIAIFHFYDARYFGAKFIRKRMLAHSPEPHDRYHKRFINTVDEIRIATGLPEVRALIIPGFAINSMALIEADKIPCILVTEGLLAEFTRDELQAVIAHELAHVVRGDNFYITLICSLANVFERLRQAVEPEKPGQSYPGRTQDASGGIPLLYIAATISVLIMHLLSTLISRQREILADAAAVEFCRNPKALAKAIYKAHIKNSFVGDFNLTYSPLFIVPPESRVDKDGFFSRLFNSHPPLMRRIRLLADMIPTPPAKIIEDIWETQRNREKAKDILLAQEEFSSPQIPEESGSSKTSSPGKIWSVQNSQNQWLGPYSLDEVLSLHIFTPVLRMRNNLEGIVAQAREFPQIQGRIRRQYQRKPLSPRSQHLCPRCKIALRDTFYEGISLKICPGCRGKLIDTSAIGRIIARKEVAFSPKLLEKAQEFKDKFMWNPLRTKKINMETSPEISCPYCGGKMLSQPYTYQYIIPVDKCFACYKTWFDSDELEILQILIENR